MNTYNNDFLQEDEILYGYCSGCGKRFPIDDLAPTAAVEAFYRTFLLRIEKGEKPQLADDKFCEGLFCKDCQPDEELEPQIQEDNQANEE